MSALPMTADLVARLEKAAAHPLLHESDARLFREAASALRSSGEAVAEICNDPFHGAGFLQWVRTDEILPIGTKLYLHPATPASAWRPKVEDFLRRLATMRPPNVVLQQITMLGEARDLLREAITPPTSTKGG